jgi:hypothetical protein
MNKGQFRRLGYALFRHRLEAYAPVPVTTGVRTSSFDARSKRDGSPQSCRKSHAANAETCLVHARAFGVERVAGPPHGLHYALIARGSFCGHEPKDVVHMQKNVDPFRESRAMVHPGAQELPGPPNENKEKKKENT